MPTSKPLRDWLADPGADQLVVDPLGGWNEPTRRAGGAPARRPHRARGGLGGTARMGELERPALDRWLEAERPRATRSRPTRPETDALTEPGLTRPRPAHGDGDLVYTASSMPIRDQEAFLPPTTPDALFLCNRGANGIDGLISSGIGAAHASGRPTTIVTGDLGLLHDIGGLAALREVEAPVRIVVIDNDGGGIFHFLPQAQALATRSSRPSWARLQVSTSPRPPPSSTFPTAASTPWPTSGGPRGRHRPDRGQDQPPHQRRDPPTTDQARRGCLFLASVVVGEPLGRASPLLLVRGAPPTLPQLSSGSSAPSFTSVSASSAAGSEPATTPTRSEEVGLAVAQQGAAQGDAVFAVLGRVHPADRAGVPAAVHPLEVGDRGLGGRPEAPSNHQHQVPQAGHSIAECGSASWAITGVARCSMFATLTISGSSAASTQTACGRRAPDDPRALDDPLLAAVLVAAQELLAEVRIVDRGVGAAPGRAGEGDRRRPRRRSSRSRSSGLSAREGRLRGSAAEAAA